MITKKQFQQVSLIGENIQREKLSPDIYAGKKLSDEYTLIVETSPKDWNPVDDISKAEGKRFLTLAKIEVLQTGRPTSIAVPAGFEELEIGKYFIFKIIPGKEGKTYADVKVEELTEAEAKKLIESDEVA